MNFHSDIYLHKLYFCLILSPMNNVRKEWQLALNGMYKYIFSQHSMTYTQHSQCKMLLSWGLWLHGQAFNPQYILLSLMCAIVLLKSWMKHLSLAIKLVTALEKKVKFNFKNRPGRRQYFSCCFASSFLQGVLFYNKLFSFSNFWLFRIVLVVAKSWHRKEFIITEKISERRKCFSFKTDNFGSCSTLAFDVLLQTSLCSGENIQWTLNVLRYL